MLYLKYSVIRGKIQPSSLLTIKFSTCRQSMSFPFAFMVCKTGNPQKWHDKQIFGWQRKRYKRYQHYLLKESGLGGFFETLLIIDGTNHHYQVTLQSFFPNSGLTSLISLISENEPDSVFQKLQRFGPNALMSLELSSGCADFPPLSSCHTCWTHMAFENCGTFIIVSALEENRNPLKF